MSFRNLLIHSCTIQTRTVTQDTTSRERKETWANTYTEVKCRLDPKSSTTGVSSTVYTESTHILFMLPISGYTITEGKNRFIVTDNIATRTYTIDGVDNAGGKGHHLEIYLSIAKF